MTENNLNTVVEVDGKKNNIALLTNKNEIYNILTSNIKKTNEKGEIEINLDKHHPDSEKTTPELSPHELIKQILVDTVKGFKEGLTEGLVTQDSLELVNAAYDAVDETYNTIDAAKNAFAGAQVVLNVATTGLLVPVSEAEVEAANNYINTYTTSSNNAVVSALTSLQLP